MWALFGKVTNDLLTLGGRVIVHDDRAELEWICPRARVVRVSERDLVKRSPLPPLPLPQHPALAGVSWPLMRSEWRD